MRGNLSLPKQIPYCGRYNLSFSTPRQVNQSSVSANQFSQTHRQKPISRQTSKNFHPSESTTSQNKTYTRYSYFPTSRKKFHSCINVEKHPIPQIKWIGIKSNSQYLDVDEISTPKSNCFPQRRKKTDNQAILNMLYKYDKHFGKKEVGVTGHEIVEREPVRHSLRQKKNPTKAGWFRKKDKAK